MPAPHPYSTVPLPDGIVIGGPYPDTIISWRNGNSRRATKTEYDLFQALETTHEALKAARGLLQNCGVIFDPDTLARIDAAIKT